MAAVGLVSKVRELRIDQEEPRDRVEQELSDIVRQAERGSEPVQTETASWEVSAMFWLKSCPRCRGDLYEGKDVYGRYVACLQCGHYLGEAEELVFRYLSQRKTQVRPEQKAGDEMTTVWAPDDAGTLQVAA